MSDDTREWKQLPGTKEYSFFSFQQPSAASLTDGNNAFVQLKAFGLNLRFTIFFDGTFNNKYNTKLNKDKKTDKGTSYTNDYSNIAKMYDYLSESTNDYHQHFALYTEGIGTSNGESDSTVVGGGLGVGDFGITQKVSDTRSRILKIIKEYGFLAINECTFDVFGFSRGAAAARYFVSQLNTLNKYLKFANLPEAKKISVCFVGLFDTVASHWFYHKNDPKDLSLDSIKIANRVVQLSALDEYRENFSSTNIHSAIQAGVGIEINLPGAHSDIGGGYPDNDEETDLQVLDIDAFLGIDNAVAKQRFDNERTLFMKEGWYINSDIAKKETWWNELKANRAGIKNSYSLIPLEIMIHHAEGYKLIFTKDALQKDLKKEDLSSVSSEIKQKVSQENWDTLFLSYMNATESSEVYDCMDKMAFWKLKNAIGTDGRGQWNKTDIVTKVLPIVRHRYFHNSSRFDGVGMDPRIVNSKGEKDLMYGERKRLILQG